MGYYKLYKRPKDNLLTVVCVNDFDLIDYEKNRFLKDKRDGYSSDLEFSSEKEAKHWMRLNIKEEYIDPEFLLPPMDYLYYKY